ncbi:MAG: helix-turn-helix transcriptional regulator [Rhodoferax sp.]|uniref:helix-turn-helix domain-containing protein n=1 Tax=Rhodoferax sp. TaxID=50421 RepID=UPI0026170514|nr:helix-turn-helix transcriptional regulator [Rhodoferax sp.]MDD2880291.1 helix-turn-helix transcriptional regulator [Rhodoferax sp.]
MQRRRLEKVQQSAKDPHPPSIQAREFLAANVRLLRGALGYSQEELAFEAGLHRTFVAHVERRARNISLDNVERLAIALKVPVHELLMPIAGKTPTT